MIHKGLLYDKKQTSSKDKYTNLQSIITQIFGPIKHSGLRRPVLFYIWSPLFDILLLKFGSSPSKTLYVLQLLSKSRRLLQHFQQQRCSKFCIVEQGW